MLHRKIAKTYTPFHSTTQNMHGCRRQNVHSQNVHSFTEYTQLKTYTAKISTRDKLVPTTLSYVWNI